MNLRNGNEEQCNNKKLLILYLLNILYVCRKSEIISIVVAALLGMPGGCLLFIPLYHPLHDFYGVPSEITSVTILIIFVTIVWKYDRKSNRYEAPPKYIIKIY